jgi:hypothetical protein
LFGEEFGEGVDVLGEYAEGGEAAVDAQLRWRGNRIVELLAGVAEQELPERGLG